MAGIAGLRARPGLRLHAVRAAARSCRCTSRCSRSPSSSTRPARRTSSPRASSSSTSWVLHRRGDGRLLRLPAAHADEPAKLVAILVFSLIGIAGSYGVAWFGIRVNTFANSRTAFACLRGKPYPTYAIPLQAGMSIGMVLISTELLLMLIILLFVPRDLRGPLLHRLRHRRVAGRLGAAHRRRYLHEDRRHRLGPDEDRLQDQGRRRAQPGRDRRLHGRQRGRLGGPLGRRLRDLRRDGRGADHLHPAGGARAVPGAAAGVDLHDAHRDGARQPAVLRSTASSRAASTRTRTR